MAGDLYITGNPDSDGLLNTNATALLIGMMLDQQVSLEWAFAGPATLLARLGHLDAIRISDMEEDDFVAVCCEKPAVHRFPASLGRRIHAACGALVADYSGNAGQIWADGPDAGDLFKRLKALPGFGDEKSKIFIALLAKRQGFRAEGWERIAAPFSDNAPRSIADIYDEKSRLAVREWKTAQKASKRDKQDRPLGAR
jgi:uncharacterized HhH-GPD family protein